MKVNKFLLFFVVIAVAFSCNKKDDFNYPAGTVGISKIVYFPSITLNGDKFVAITEGSAFADPGATAVLNGAPTTYTTDPVINASTAPGVYTVTYTAKNPEGYTASVQREVAVTPAAVAADPVIIGHDFSGTYLRSATGVTSTWTKIGTGVYTVENPGGSSGVGKRVIVTNYSGNSIQIPSQTSPDFGPVSSGSEVYTVGPPTKYQWVFFATGYGTSLRKFVKL